MSVDFCKLGESYTENKGSNIGKETVGRFRRHSCSRNGSSDPAVSYHTALTLRSRGTGQHILSHPGGSHTTKAQERPSE